MRTSLRFILVGGFCAALSNVLVIVLVHVGMNIALASTIAFFPVLVIGYALHSCFTFGADSTRISFARYTLATATNFPLWLCSLYLLCSALHLPVAIAAPLTTLLLFLWSFVLIHWAFNAQLLQSFRRLDPESKCPR